jgi:hypothetical protein
MGRDGLDEGNVDNADKASGGEVLEQVAGIIITIAWERSASILCKRV